MSTGPWPIPTPVLWVAHTDVNVFKPPAPPGQPKEPHPWPGRARCPVRALVVHVMDGTWAGSLAWARNPESEASFHYGIAKSGKVAEVVDPDGPYAPWANGIVNDRETALPPALEDLIYPDGPNANWVTISLEFEGKPFASDFPTTAQYQSGAHLAAWLCQRFGIVPGPTTVLPHRAFSTRERENCPGPRMDLGRLIADARVWRATGKPPVERDTMPVVIPVRNLAQEALERSWQQARSRLGPKVVYGHLMRPWGDETNTAKPCLVCRGGLLLLAGGQVVEVTGRALDDLVTYWEQDGSFVAQRGEG